MSHIVVPGKETKDTIHTLSVTVDGDGDTVLRCNTHDVTLIVFEKDAVYIMTPNCLLKPNTTLEYHDN